MDQCFLQAMFYRPPTLLGRAMRPFSLGHVVVLLAANSPLAAGGPVTWQDVVFCCYICALGWADLSDRIADPQRIADEAASWGAQVGPFNPVETARELGEYIAASSASPTRWQTGNERPMRLPWPFVVARAIRPGVDVASAACMDMPVGRALVEYACMAEASGAGDDYMTDDERAGIAALKAPEAI